MKYGKEFQQILDASDFPDDWKTSAIEYRKVSIGVSHCQGGYPQWIGCERGKAEMYIVNAC